MNIPSNLKIGPYDVEVKIEEHLAIDRKNGGEWHPRDLKILLDASLTKRHGEILLHEIIEAVCDIYDLEIEHHQMMVLSSALYQALKDNKIIF